jgi:hypothetical protein
MMYLMDGSSVSDASLLRVAASRLRNLPDTHAMFHKPGDTIDMETPTPCRGATDDGLAVRSTL